MTRALAPHRIRLLAAASLFVALALALFTQPALAGPFNTSSEGGDGKLMLRGHDPVAYFTQGRHVPGKPELRSQHDGVTYRFASAEHKAMFDREPAKYAPQFGGFCSNGIVYGIPWGGDPDTWKIVDGKLYIFGGEGSKRYFLMDEAKNLELAHRYWKDEVDGSIGIIQRFWRLIWRVPHYKTGKQLEDEYQRRLKAGEIKAG
jgi:YHS domain-containing protein